MDDDIAGRLIPGIVLMGASGSVHHRAGQPWFYVRGQVVEVAAAKGLLTIEPQLLAVSQRQPVDIQVDAETAMESRHEGSPAKLAMDDISLGDVLAVEGSTLAMIQGRPVVHALSVVREKRGAEG